MITLNDLTFLIDSREQRPLEFLSPNIPPSGPLRLKTEVTCLKTGDYTVKGIDYEGRISIERKALGDLVMCCGSERERFEREIERLLEFETRLVIVEASWDEIMLGQWRGSKLNPNQVMGSVQGWMARGIPFFFHHDRRILASFIRNFMLIKVRRIEREKHGNSY
jgi:ERCC4-type nuclease